MTQEDKELLLKDLCARLKYKPKCESKQLNGGTVTGIEITGDCNARIQISLHGALKCTRIHVSLNDFIKHHPLYLRPMSSMTEEERNEFVKLHIDDRLEGKIELCDASCVDFYNARHLDYRGLIEKDLALESPEGMYNIKEK